MVMVVTAAAGYAGPVLHFMGRVTGGDLPFLPVAVVSDVATIADELSCDKLGVQAVPVQQLPMVALLHSVAAVQHHDAVGIPDCGQPVGDDEGGASLHQTLQRLAHLAFVDCVQMGRGLVQDQYGSILQQGPGDGQPLALASGELHSPLPDHCVVPVGERGDEIMSVGLPGRLLHFLLAGFGPSQAYIVPDGGVEKVGVLRDQRDLFPEGVQTELPNVVASQPD